MLFKNSRIDSVIINQKPITFITGNVSYGITLCNNFELEFGNILVDYFHKGILSSQAFPLIQYLTIRGSIKKNRN
jgi:hypothetical protein